MEELSTIRVVFLTEFPIPIAIGDSCTSHWPHTNEVDHQTKDNSQQFVLLGWCVSSFPIVVLLGTLTNFLASRSCDPNVTERHSAPALQENGQRKSHHDYATLSARQLERIFGTTFPRSAIAVNRTLSDVAIPIPYHKPIDSNSPSPPPSYPKDKSIYMHSLIRRQILPRISFLPFKSNRVYCHSYSGGSTTIVWSDLFQPAKRGAGHKQDVW